MTGALRAAYRGVIGWSPLEKDAFLYLCSAVFAALTAVVAVSADYREWGEMAGVAYGLGAAVCVGALAFGRRRPLASGSISWLRRLVLIGVLAGAVIAPLLAEITWRADALPGQHAQAEVAAVERSGDRLANGEDPYLRHPTSVGVSPSTDQKSIDATSFFAYLPGMAAFGLNNDLSGPPELTDARLLLAGFTLVVGAAALMGRGASVGRRGRALQFLVVLPSGALPMVTGGDDLPVLALMLVGLLLAERRRPVLSGVALGLAGTLKFTAWPVLLLLLLAVRDADDRPARGRYAAAVAAIVVPIVGAGFVASPTAFFVNVVQFPLGLAGIHSPAASPLLGQVLVSIFPHDRRTITVAMLAIGVLLVAYGLRRFPPRRPAEVARFAGWVMLLATVLAPATRFGYLIYPANLFVWGYLLDGMEKARPEGAYSTSATSKSRTSTELVGATSAPPSAGLTEALVGRTITPTSQ